MLLTKTSIVTKNQYNISLTNVATLIETIYPGHGKYIPHYPAPVDSHQITLANLRGGAAIDASPLGVQILSISCSVWENLAKLYVGAPLPTRVEVDEGPLTMGKDNFPLYKESYNQ